MGEEGGPLHPIRAIKIFERVSQNQKKEMSIWYRGSTLPVPFPTGKKTKFSILKFNLIFFRKDFKMNTDLAACLWTFWLFLFIFAITVLWWKTVTAFCTILLLYWKPINHFIAPLGITPLKLTQGYIRAMIGNTSSIMPSFHLLQLI